MESVEDAFKNDFVNGMKSYTCDKFKTPHSNNDKNMTEYLRNLSIENRIAIIGKTLVTKALYHHRYTRLLSLTVDTSHQMRDIIYAGVSDGRILKITLNAYELNTQVYFFEPILIQEFIIFNDLPVNHIKLFKK